jgi:REP element-mobilizing transposase RayT
LIQRGNNRQAIFTCDADLAPYANWLAQGADQFGVKVHGWVFMTNQLHILATKKRQLARRALINENLNFEVIAKVRHFASAGLVPGSESFREQVHKLRY